MKKSIVSLFLILVFAVQAYPVSAKSSFAVKSATLTPGYDLQLALNNAKTLGVNTVNISVKVDIPNISSADMSIQADEKKKFLQALKAFSSQGHSIMVEPYPWINGGTETETDYNPADTALFFANWERVLVEILDMTKVYKLKGFLVADNFYHLYKQNAQWVKIVDNVKKRTKAPLGIKLNWWYNADWDKSSFEYYDSLFQLEYLKKADYISIPAYFELLDEPTTDVLRLKNAWYSSERYDRKQPIFDQIKKLSQNYGKPIFFGEVGYTHFDRCVVAPYEYSGDGTVNQKVQQSAYKAFFETFRNQDFIQGFSLFQIGVKDSYYYFMGTAVEKDIKGYIKQ